MLVVHELNGHLRNTVHPSRHGKYRREHKHGLWLHNSYNQGVRQKVMIAYILHASVNYSKLQGGRVRNYGRVSKENGSGLERWRP